MTDAELYELLDIAQEALAVAWAEVRRRETERTGNRPVLRVVEAVGR